MKHFRPYLSSLLLAIVFAGLLAYDPGASAQQAKPLTIGEAIGIASGLRQMKTYKALDKDGKLGDLPFKFSGSTIADMARNISLGDAEAKLYQEAVNILIFQLSDGGTQVPPGKMADFNKQTSAMLEKPADVKMIRIKESALKLGDGANENPIPPEIVALVVPILDK